MIYWVVRQENDLVIRISGPHYAEASAWDAYDRIKASKDTAEEVRALKVVDEYNNEQQHPEPKHMNKH